MLFVFFIFNVIMTVIFLKSEKFDNEFIKSVEDCGCDSCFHKKSDFLVIKEFPNRFDFSLIFSSWLFFLYGLFSDVNIQHITIIYIVNFMYSRILKFLYLIEIKIDIIRKKIYNEEE